MLLPDWALEKAERLDLDGFSTAFSRAWSMLNRKFLKLECWQAYRELDLNASQRVYEAGEVKQARKLLAAEAEADRPLYDDVTARGLDYARIRLVQAPPSPYLAYEMMSYEIRYEMGENIEIVRIEPGIALPNDQYFDFLLFDLHTALIHDYGNTGTQVGGWVTGDVATIKSLERTARSLREAAVPLPQFTW